MCAVLPGSAGFIAQPELHSDGFGAGRVLGPAAGQSDILIGHGERITGNIGIRGAPAVKVIAIKLRSVFHTDLCAGQIGFGSGGSRSASGSFATIGISHRVSGDGNRGGFGQRGLLAAIGQAGVIHLICACNVGGVRVGASRPGGGSVGGNAKADDQLFALPRAVLLHHRIRRVIKAGDADLLSGNGYFNISGIKGFIFGPYRRFAFAAGLINLNGDTGGRGEPVRNGVGQDRAASCGHIGNHFIRDSAEDSGQATLGCRSLIITLIIRSATHIGIFLRFGIIAGHRVHEPIDILCAIGGFCTGKDTDGIDDRASVLQLLSLTDCIVCNAAIKTIAMVGLAVGEEDNDLAALAAAQNGIGMLQTIVGRSSAGSLQIINSSRKCLGASVVHDGQFLDNLRVVIAVPIFFVHAVARIISDFTGKLHDRDPMLRGSSNILILFRSCADKLLDSFLQSLHLGYGYGSGLFNADFISTF